MSNDESDEGNAKGKETPIVVTPAEKVRKDKEELKAENDAYDAEILRAEIIRAERQRGGMSSAGQETKISEEQTPKEYAAQVMAGKV